MKHTHTVAIYLILLAASAVTVHAGVTVHLVDGQATQGDGIALASGKLTVTGAGGAVVGQWAVDDVAEIDFGRAADGGDDAKDARWVMVVGGKLRGTVTAFNGKAFSVAANDFGDVDLPVACVQAVVLAERIPGQLASNDDTPADVIVMSNMDRLSGTLNALDDKTVRFHSDLGDLSLDRARVAAIRIAAPPGGRPKRAVPALKLTLAGGTEVELAGVETTADGKITGTITGGPAVSVPLATVVKIGVIGGRLVYLETFEPGVYEQLSLDILKWDIRRGLNVLGRPMRLRRDKGQEPREFERGIGVHGPCRIVYQLNGQYERFIALAGVDESAGRWADANVVVKVDGKETFRADHVRWREPARQVNVALAGARQVELIVEAGEHFDVQDRINWADARLIRKAVPADK